MLLAKGKMKFGTEKTTKKRFRAVDVLPQPEEESRQAPSELLTPEIKRGLLDTKRGYEGGIIGDRIPMYTRFLAAVQRCWSELQEEFKIAPAFRGDALDRIPNSMKGILGNEEYGSAVVAYDKGVDHLFTMAFLEPSAVKATVEEYQNNLLLLLKSDLLVGRFAYALELACILQLGLPESRKKTDEIFQGQTAELATYIKKSKAWFNGGLAKLLITDFTVDVPHETRAALLRTNKTELLRLAQNPNHGETLKLNQQLNDIFGLGVLLADEATLLPNGTVRYTYASKAERQKPLPERPLN